MEAVKVIVSGHVQGVGFRDFTRRTAQSIGVAGWVRNRGDGTVEVLVEGEEAQLDQMLDALGDGPASARVEEMEVAEVEPTGKLEGFSVRH